MRRAFMLGLVLAALLAGIALATAVGDQPAGTTVSHGDSMGDDEPMVEVWVDAQPEVGDVVIFEVSEDGDHDLDSDLVVHRVVDEREEGFVTRGDANLVVDQDVRGVDHATEENVVGVVVARVPVSTVRVVGTFLPIPVVAAGVAIRGP